MKVRWMLWLEQYGQRVIGQGFETQAEARGRAPELATETRRLKPGGHDCLLYRNGRLYDHWIEYLPETAGKGGVK